MKFPFIKKNKKLSIVEPLQEGKRIKKMKASALFVSSSDEEKHALFQKALEEVNKEQKEVVDRYNKATAI